MSDVVANFSLGTMRRRLVQTQLDYLDSLKIIRLLQREAFWRDGPRQGMTDALRQENLRSVHLLQMIDLCRQRIHVLENRIRRSPRPCEDCTCPRNIS